MTRDEARGEMLSHLREAEAWANGEKSWLNETRQDQLVFVRLADSQESLAHSAVAQVYATLLSGPRTGIFETPPIPRAAEGRIPPPTHPAGGPTR